jgi:hypothetical protein
MEGVDLEKLMINDDEYQTNGNVNVEVEISEGTNNLLNNQTKQLLKRKRVVVESYETEGIILRIEEDMDIDDLKIINGEREWEEYGGEIEKGREGGILENSDWDDVIADKVDEY